MRQLAFAALLACAALIGPARAADEFIDCFRHTTDNADDKIDICTRLIQSGRWQDKDVATLLANRALGYMKDGSLDNAMGDLNRAIRLDSQQIYAFDQRGEVWRLRGDYEKAMLDFSKVLELDPEFIAAYYDRANAYKAMGQIDKARADYKTALQRAGKGRALDEWAKNESRKLLDELDKK